MNVQVSLLSLYTSGELLQDLKQSRESLIDELSIGLRSSLFLEPELKITGKEKRPFTDEELEGLVKHYKHFKDFFDVKCLLPIQKLNQENNTSSKIHRLMLEYNIDKNTAEKAQEQIDMGMDKDTAVEFANFYSE